MRKLLFLAALALLGAATVLVPLPLVVVQPAPAISVPAHLNISDSSHQTSGNYFLTAVELRAPSAAAAVTAWADSHEDVSYRNTFAPAGISNQEFNRIQRRLFEESVKAAAASGMRAAGLSVQVSGDGARVVGVVSGSPAAGTLRQGDVITAIDGRQVQLAATLVAATESAHAGDSVTLTVQRGNQTVTKTITLRRVDQLGHAGIGVAVETLHPDIQLPRKVNVDLTNVGGPSGGLMMAVSVYDLVSPVDLARGRKIAGTGTIDLAGNVGPIGEIQLKVVAARRAGAQVFLAPAKQAARAREAADGRIRVVGVKTLREAVAVLRR